MSKMFVQRAMKIERELLPIMRANNSDVVAIRVHRFRNGRNATHMMSNNTVIINFIIILKDNATRDIVTKEQHQDCVNRELADLENGRDGGQA